MFSKMIESMGIIGYKFLEDINFEVLYIYSLTLLIAKARGFTILQIKVNTLVKFNLKGASI